MSEQSAQAGEPEPSEEELRAAYEAQVKQIRVDQIVLENVVTVLNLGMRKTGMAPGTEDERDPEQVRIAIESVRLQLPLIERALPNQVGQIRDALSQLQMAFVKIGGQAPAAPSGAPEPGPARPEPAPAADEPAPGKPGEPGPAQRSGRLWIPGQ